MQGSEEHQSQVYEEEESKESSHTVSLESLRSKLAFSNIQLQKLSLDDNAFFSKIKQYNDSAVAEIQKGNNRQALVYLSQAERMLEYGAVRGKTIDRNLILCVLNNQAVAYQKQWVVEKTAKYTEALIYNIESFIEDDNVPLELVYGFESSSRQQKALCLSTLKKKNMLIRYYLIYCALMSQSKHHQIALQNSFKALLLLKEMFAGYSRYYKSNAFREKDERMFTAKKLRLLKELSSYNEHLELSSYETLFQRTQYMLKEWRQNKSQVSPEDKIQLQVKDFSIAKVMQSQAQTYAQFDRPLDFTEEISMRGLTKKVLLFSINFFSIATQIRLIDAPRYVSPEDKIKSLEFKRSELYHLTAIKVFCTYIPYDSLLVKHIQTSYANHYKYELNVENVEYINDDQFLDDKKNPKSSIDSDKQKYVATSYRSGECQEEDLIRPARKVSRKKKTVPALQIPKSPTSKPQPPTSKKKIVTDKTPRKLQSPPLPSTKRGKDPTPLVSPRVSDRRNASSSKGMSGTGGFTFENQKTKQRSQSKKKSKLSKEKGDAKTKKKSKSKSVHRQKTKQSQFQMGSHSKRHFY